MECICQITKAVELSRLTAEAMKGESRNMSYLEGKRNTVLHQRGYDSFTWGQFLHTTPGSRLVNGFVCVLFVRS